jgi:thymidylate synthase (FAD)
MIEATYIDHMGSDLSVVNAARVSFGKKSEWMPRIHYGEELVLKPKDARLIRFLAKHNHKSPFNHTFVTFHVKAPVFVARQLVKHEYMPWNEISRRYVDEEPELYWPDEWRGRSADKKQGSEGTVDLKQIGDYLEYGDDAFSYEYLKENGSPSHPRRSFESCLEGQLDTLVSYYKSMIHYGVCPEQARMILPQSMMTEWYWSGTLFAFAKMCGLRLKEDTQAETRIVAEKVEDVMAKLYPVSWEALRMYEE